MVKVKAPRAETPSDGQDGPRLTRVSAVSAAMFFSAACGYVLSLGSITFDLIVPSLFLWALVSGVVLNLYTSHSVKHRFLDCVATAIAFSASPILFASLRGLLAFHAGEVPNAVHSFGYGVLRLENLDAFHGLLRTGKWFFVFVLVSLPLLVLGSLATAAIVLGAKKLFEFGPEKVDRSRALLLKSGALILVLASGVAVVASLSRERAVDRTDKIEPGTYQGTLILQRPDRGRYVAEFFPEKVKALRFFLTPAPCYWLSMKKQRLFFKPILVGEKPSASVTASKCPASLK